MSYFRSYILLVLLWLSVFPAVAGKYLFETGGVTNIYIDRKEKEVVHTALELLQKDVRQVFDSELRISDDPGHALIVAGTIGQNPKIARLAKKYKLDFSELSGAWEAFRILSVKSAKKKMLFVVGSDPRGTAYGLLELSRRIGVSPWHYFADVKPAKSGYFLFPEMDIFEKPAVRYRGIFLNDEDWGLMPWATRTLDPESDKGAIGPKAYARIFELLLRLRANTIWPAMHECTVPFYFVAGNRETADRYGIVVGTSHCEPMMRCSASEWDAAGTGEYNYVTNKVHVLDYWADRLKTLRNSENIYTIGMRGKHDGVMQGVKTLEDHRFYLSKIIRDQQELLSRYIDPEVASIPQVFIPYKEVLDVYDAGLDVPEYVTLVWCDDNYGYIRRLSGEKERARSGGSGVYYHVSYWGRPHDYLWLTTTSPALVYTEMKRAYEHGADRLWILNVGDLKPAEYLTEYFMDLAWNIGLREERIYPVFDHLKEWSAREFGPENAEEISSVMRSYYHLANVRKPEMMGWSRVEESGYPRRLTPVRDSEYNPDFQGELNRRIERYQALEISVEGLKSKIPAYRESAFFELVEYPVRGASLMNRKWLFAQLARHASDSVKRMFYRKESLDAYAGIAAITATYNALENGKWNRIMDANPRKLPVFARPDFKEQTTEDRVLPDYVSAFNASEAINLPDQENVIEGLGHSFSAVKMQKDQTLEFLFEIPAAGEYRIKVAAVPNHDVDGQGMKIALSVDGQRIGVADYSVDGRSETWKEHVLRGQAISSFTHYFPARRKFRISITALSPELIPDQIMVVKGEDDFYEFPVKVKTE